MLITITLAYVILENLYQIVILFTGVVAAVVTQELSIWRRFGAVRASAIVSLFFSLVVYALPNYDYVLVIPAVAMGASFVAMSTRGVVPTRRWMTVTGLIFGLVFLFTNPQLEGYGGVLGTGACVSVLMSIGLRRLSGFLRRSIRRYFIRR
jgi:hypothetical protein